MIDLAGYLFNRYGGLGGLIVRDPGSPTGLREWSDQDTQDLTLWWERNNLGHQTTCLNLVRTAETLGLSIHSTQRLMRRERDPLPHMRDGRRIIVPTFLLTQWIADEVQRQRQSGQHA